MEWERTGENNCGIGWGESREWNGWGRENNCGIESREWNGREHERMGENRREQLWHWLGRE